MKKTDDKELAFRRNLKLHLISNPNYFGNLKDLDLPDLPDPKVKIVGNTNFEELTCVGHNPASDILAAIVEIKRPNGYSGDSCTDGSREYVRFYLDYGDGTWIDHGLASFDAHDLGFDEDLCYAVSLRIDPKKRRCCDRKPVLPRVLAILSWNVAPPPNTPAWAPVWGNRLVRDIQIAPRHSFLCTLIDVLDGPCIEKLTPHALAMLKEQLASMDIPKAPPAPLEKRLKKVEKGDRLGQMRAVYPQVMKLASDNTDIAAAQALAALPKLGIDLSKFDDFILKPNFNTTYEELHCVGLDRDAENLHGVIEIKRKAGYAGDLCDDGSREYIAFYLDFGSGWEYQGTTFVDVHDIDEIPDGGLWYQAQLPVNLEKHKKEWCKAGKARIRGILSWASPPPANQPNHVPHWGNREDCRIELRPLPRGVPEGELTPFIESIGSMPVDRINALGFANGDNIGGTLTADESPFGGVIRIAGQVAFPSSNNLEYRVMVKGPSDAVHKPWTKSFDVTVFTVIGPFLTISTVNQVANGDWFEYIPQAGPVFRSVAGNLLAPFTAAEEGLHSVYIEVREAGGAVPLAGSSPEHFFIDNTRPVVDVEITSGAGNCGKFTIGDQITGTFSMADLHSRSLSLSVTPQAEASGGLLAFTSRAPAAPLPVPAPGATASNSLSHAALTLDTTGASGTWSLDTTAMDPCGYNIRIHGEDRTIVNSGFIGWEATDIEGFCLDNPEA